MQTLDQLGKELKIPQSSITNDYLVHYEKEISTRWDGKCKIIVISNSNPDKLSTILALRFPESEILIISYKKDMPTFDFLSHKNVSQINFETLEDLLVWSVSLTSVDVIIEHSANFKSHKINLFKTFFLYLNRNGIYFIEELHAKFIPELNDCDGGDILDFLHELINLKNSPKEILNKLNQFEVFIANSVKNICVYNKLAMVSKLDDAFIGLRTKEASDLIRSGRLKGSELLFSNFPAIFQLKTPSNGNSKKLMNRHPNSYKLPPSYINKFNNATCLPGQVVYQGKYLLPDSFRMQHHPKLLNKNIKYLKGNVYDLNVIHNGVQLNGNYLYLDSEYPGHFGHFTSEVVSRLWAWKKLKKSIPDLKVLLSVLNGKTLPSFSKSILNSYGILDNEIVTFESGVHVENLYTASPFYAIGGYIHPEITEVWDSIHEGIIGGKSQINGDKLFIARPMGGGRKCLNPEALELMFKDAGFEFFSPENFSWEDQIRTFSQAKCIAGYSGSGLFNTMFSKNIQHMISIGSDSYTAVNEHYICAIKNIELDYIWADSLLKHEGSWSSKAFMSNYEFNYQRDLEYLKNVLEKIK